MNAATRAWIAHHDPESLARAALDYVKHVHALGPFPPEPVLRRDFDAAALARVEAELVGVDRRAALEHLASALLGPIDDDPGARHVALLSFVQRIAFANLWQPVRADGTAVRDPVVLLHLGQLRCGQAAGLAADLFEAAGMPTRLCLLGHHIVAEAWYEDAHGRGWHAIDADGFACGTSPRRDDGTIPSVAELSRDPDRLDACATGVRPSFARLPDPEDGRVRRARILAPRALPTRYPSTAWFGADGVPPRPTGFRYAQRRDDADRSGPDYGWNRRVVESATDILPSDRPERCFPPAPCIRGIELDAARPGVRRVTVQVHLELPPATTAADPGPCAEPILELRVGRRSRGWQHADAAAPPAVQPMLAVRPWQPGHYDRLHELPPDDLGCHRLHPVALPLEQPLEPSGPVAFEVPAGAAFLSAMASDAHGRRVGRTLYPLSPELDLSG